MRVYNLHLSNRDGNDFAPIYGRWKQGEVVYNHALKFLEKNESAPVAIAGDFNSLNQLYNPWKKELTMLNFLKEFKVSSPHFSPTMIIAYKTDWIFYKNLKLKKKGTSWFVASDHFPIFAIFNDKT